MMREDEALAAMRRPLLQPAGPRPGLWKLLREDVRCVLERDPAARSRFEVWTIYPGVQAVALHRAAHALWQRGWRFLPRAISFFARWLTNVDIHPAARIGRRFFIDHGAGVVIGETAEVGDDVTMYHGVTLGGTTWNPGKRHPSVGHGALIGAGAKILGAIEVGHRARIAANSVVIEDVPDGATVVGNPGRVVIPRHRRQQAAHGFDLDHHLIPDPVGKAIGCLLERVAQLEQQLQARQGTAPGAGLVEDPSGCSGCDDSCAEPHFGALARRTGARP